MASGQMVYGFYYLFMCLSRANEFYHLSLRMCVSPVFSFTLFTGLLDACLTDGQAMGVFLIKEPSSSPQTCFRLDTSSHLRSMHQLLVICEELD